VSLRDVQAEEAMASPERAYAAARDDAARKASDEGADLR
jgi:hypothetical protein